MSVLSAQQIKAYSEDGFFFAREMFSAEEIHLLRETATNDHAMDQAASLRDDGTGASVRLSLWNHPGDGIYGMFAAATASLMPSNSCLKMKSITTIPR